MTLTNTTTTNNYGICQHPNCNNIATVKVSLMRRGGRPAYMCEHHAHRLEGYSTENRNRVGTAKVNGFTCSIELETSFSTATARAELFANDYIATSDITVNAEYKSPIMSGFNKLSKQCTTIEMLMAKDELDINESCGTHLHIGHVEYINAETMGYIRRFAHSLFIPLSEAIESDRAKAEAFFGRALGGWAIGINELSSATQHKNFINLEHNPTIEFRQLKFVNAKQYMSAVKFCKDVVTAVINNFIKHFNDTDFDTTRYNDITAFRKHKAQMTAKKLVKLYDKYTANI